LPRRNKSLSAEGGASQLVHLKQEMRISFCKLSFPVHLSSAAWRVPLAVWDIPHLKPGSEASFLCRRVL
jgi:2-phospho-L-lactate guanylyltransferase (CobY/MobA/RfbA family)